MYSITPSVIPTVSSRYSTPLLNAIGPTLNQVSSLNSFVGEKTLLATSGALWAVTPNRTAKITIPPIHAPKIDHPILRLVLMPRFSPRGAPAAPGTIGGAAEAALITAALPRARARAARRTRSSRQLRSGARPRARHGDDPRHPR